MIAIWVPDSKWPLYIINPPLYCLAATARGSTLESASLMRYRGTNVPLAPRYPTNIFDPQLGFATLVSLTRSPSWLSWSLSVQLPPKPKKIECPIIKMGA